MTPGSAGRGELSDDIVNERIELLFLVGPTHGFYLPKIQKPEARHLGFFRADFVRQRFHLYIIGRRDKELLHDLLPELADFTMQNVRLVKKLFLSSLNLRRLLRREIQLSSDKTPKTAPSPPEMARRPHAGLHALLIPDHAERAQIQNYKNG
jgi:hypothetical protein